MEKKDNDEFDNPYTSEEYGTSSVPFLNEVFEPIKPLSIQESELVCSVAMNKDYTDTITAVILAINNYSEDIPNDDDYPYFKENQTIKFLPKLNEHSEILSERQLRELHQSLPYYHKYKNMKLLYSTSKDGIAMKTFYQKTQGYLISIVLIKDDNQNVFGGFLSEEIRKSDKFYGTGESFVFTFHNGERIHVYEGTCENEYYIYSDDEIFAMGCSDNFFSIVVRDDFLKGSSRHTITYKNPILSGKEEFFCQKFEVWTLED
jgi:hypothetical protein